MFSSWVGSYSWLFVSWCVCDLGLASFMGTSQLTKFSLLKPLLTVCSTNMELILAIMSMSQCCRDFVYGQIWGLVPTIWENKEYEKWVKFRF